MAVPPVVIGLLAKVAGNGAVQAGAERLLRDVYGRVLARTDRVDPAEGEPEDDMPAQLAALRREVARRDEVAASFALLQAELDRRHRLTVGLLAAVLVVQAGTVALLLG